MTGVDEQPEVLTWQQHMEALVIGAVRGMAEAHASLEDDTGGALPPLNDLTPLTTGRRWLGYATLVILVLILVPLPHTLWPAAGIHCPYVR